MVGLYAGIADARDDGLTGWAAGAGWDQAQPSGTDRSGRYQPKFPGDPARSDSEAKALGYMRVVLRARASLQKTARQVCGIAGASGGHAVRSPSAWRIQPTAGITRRHSGHIRRRAGQGRLCADDDAQAHGRRPPVVLCRGRWSDSRGRSEGGRCGVGAGEVGAGYE